jgi:hypothetical protein
MGRAGGHGRPQNPSRSAPEIIEQFSVVAVACAFKWAGRLMSTMSCPAAQAIALLVSVRDQLEFAARPPGELVTTTRQITDAILNDLGIAARLIREMAERGRD